MTEHPDEMTDEEREGVRMIQGLQLFAGRVEPAARALAQWRAMPPWCHEMTRTAYALLCEVDEP